jgi:Putative beta-barrel porin-2, OmpL-like. bbp2
MLMQSKKTKINMMTVYGKNSSKQLLIFLALILSLILHCSKVTAQNESHFTFSGYADFYYAYDNDNNGSDLRQFSVISPIRDQFRINIAQVTGKYLNDNIRGMLTLQFGDIPNYNWPPSPNQFLQNIQEANVGFRPVKNLWVDAGYFLTHIGAEGIIPINNYLNTQALMTFYEPIYQSGIRVFYDFSDKVYGSLYFLNGYNVLADNNLNKSGGMQFGVKPAKNLEIIYSNIFGNEQPQGSPGKTRFYNDFVLKYAALKNLDFLLGADFATQQKSDISDTVNSATLFSGLLSVRYNFIKNFYLAARGEYYEDNNGVLSGLYVNNSGNLIGLKASGIAFGIEFTPKANAYIRAEARFLKTGNDLYIFTHGDTPNNERTEIILGTGVEF